ncbi:type III pantothenate kinase [Anaerococcus marasmi]|uniref:type III pantothenate kinase n=1 Tax=Anaerococcus marasmi TaxID=2057797 RepID=UPI000CF9FFF9|nr:type III pantothenate kinase [Anaerococcus marasmi]
MLLAIDIENRNTDFGVFNNGKLAANFNLSSIKDRSASELFLIIKYLLLDEGIKLSDISDIIISSVVPELDRKYMDIAYKISNKKPYYVSAGLKTGINIKYDNPKDVGSDRIIRAVGSKNRSDKNLIIVQASTITTIDYINNKNEFLGGAIMPGIDLFQESLVRESAKLPQVDIVKVEKILGKSTTKAMQNGIYYSYKKSVEAIIGEIIEQNKLDKDNTEIITSGEYADFIEYRDLKIKSIPNLGLLGLKDIYELNSK